MDAETKLASKFYHIFGIYLTAIIVLFMIMVITFIIKNKFKNKSALYVSLLVILGFFIYFTIKFIPYAKDYNNVKNNLFYTVTGIVIDYGKARSIGDIASEIKYYYPIIEDTDGNHIQLDVNGTELNQTYTFIYLEHSKLAVLKLHNE